MAAVRHIEPHRLCLTETLCFQMLHAKHVFYVFHATESLFVIEFGYIQLFIKKKPGICSLFHV